MEITTADFGTVPTAVQILNQCLATYELFIEGKEDDKTATPLGMGLSIEEGRLVHWGEASGLQQQDLSKSQQLSAASALDARLLQDPIHCDVAVKILTCIKSVLYDTEALSTRYGMRIAGTEILKEAEKSNALALEVEADDNTPPLSPVFSQVGRFRWAIKDREQFSQLVDRLRHFNDSLYSLLPREAGITMNRDVCAFLLSCANDENLLQYRSLERERKAVSAVEQSHYGGISAAASVAIKMRRQTVKDDAVTIIPESEIRLDTEASRLATWSKGDTRVCVEVRPPIRGEEQGETFENSRFLASLLNRTSTARELRTLRCFGVSKLDSGSARMVYKIPDDADPLAEPRTLHEMLADESGWVPTLDDRFELARIICGAIYQMHSAGWMHRDISSHNILFFKSKSKGESKATYSICRPYLKGFKYSRQLYVSGSDTSSQRGETRGEQTKGEQTKGDKPKRRRREHENGELLRDAIYQHPAYLFHKLLSEAQSDGRSELRDYERYNDKEAPYTQRHEYYSLGLLLLEIGLWRPLQATNLVTKPVASTGIWDFPLSLSLNYDLGPWEERDLHGRVKTATKTIRAARHRLSQSDDDDDAWPDELQPYIQTLRQVLQEEHVEGVALHTWNAARPDNIESFWSLWDEVYPHTILRKDAAELATRAVGMRMGRRYTQVIMRCLESDFSMPLVADEFTWLRAFNWLVLQELDKCCI